MSGPWADVLNCLHKALLCYHSNLNCFAFGSRHFHKLLSAAHKFLFSNPNWTSRTKLLPGVTLSLNFAQLYWCIQTLWMVLSIIGGLIHTSIDYGPGSGEGIHCSCTATLKEMTLRKHEWGEGGVEAWLHACSVCKTQCASRDNMVVINTLGGRLVSNVLLYAIQRRKDYHSMPYKALSQDICPFKCAGPRFNLWIVSWQSSYLLPLNMGEPKENHP